MNIVQIGCFDGNDEVYRFVSGHQNIITKLVLVDPLSKKLDEAKNRYSQYNFVSFVNCAIVPSDSIKNIKMYYPIKDDLKHAQLTSYNKKNITVFFQDNEISEFIAPCLSINQLFENHQLFNIDRLYIDTEGLDCQIIQSINFKKYNISYIEYEYIHSDGVNIYGHLGKETEKLLLSMNYKQKHNPPFNMVFYK